MDDLFEIIGQYRRRDERRSQAPDPALELLLITKVSEEANEAAERYRCMNGWGTDGSVTATLSEVQDELCATAVAALVALDRLSPDGDAAEHWRCYLDYGYRRASAENDASQTG